MFTVVVCLVGGCRSKHFRKWLEALVEMGYLVSVITDQDCPLGCTTYHLLPIGGFDLRMLMSNVMLMRSFIRQIEPDIIHVQYAIPYAFYVAAANVQRPRPSILTVWGSDVAEWGTRAYSNRLLLRWAFSRFDAITAETERMSTMVTRIGGVRSCHTLVGPSGVDRRVFRPLTDKRIAKERLGIDPASKVLVSPRAMRPNYNIHAVLRAFNTFKRSHPESILLQADYGDEQYSRAIRRLVRELGITDAVRFFYAGSESEMALFYNAADITVSVPNSDQLSRCVIESLCCGTPCVVTDIEPICRIVVESGGVVIQRGDDESQIESALEALLTTGRPSRVSLPSTLRALTDRSLALSEIRNLYLKVLGRRRRSVHRRNHNAGTRRN